MSCRLRSDWSKRPGAGKTAFLERTLARLRQTRRVAALVGDLATDNDAARLRRTGVPVRQITTGTICHLDAGMVAAALEGWRLEELDMLFVENVGNLVCPASYDLGEDTRAVLVSVTEGEDKPLKYPTIFNTADVVVVTKMDMAGAARFDRAALLENLRRVSPGADVIEVSAIMERGLDTWLRWLTRREREMHPGPEDPGPRDTDKGTWDQGPEGPGTVTLRARSLPR